MHNDIQEILLTEEQIQEKVKELSAILREEYKDKDPIFVGVMKGVVIFFADMVRHIDIPCQIDFMWISSYQGTHSKELIVKRDISSDIKGRHVVILEDIFDTGNSLSFVHAHLMEKEPASLKICTLLDKPSRRQAERDCYIIAGVVRKIHAGARKAIRAIGTIWIFGKKQGNEVDLEKAAAIVMEDFRSGKLGQLTLEVAP